MDIRPIFEYSNCGSPAEQTAYGGHRVLTIRVIIIILIMVMIVVSAENKSAHILCRSSYWPKALFHLPSKESTAKHKMMSIDLSFKMKFVGMKVAIFYFLYSGWQVRAKIFL